jgi:hypothetical protein
VMEGIWTRRPRNQLSSWGCVSGEGLSAGCVRMDMKRCLMWVSERSIERGRWKYAD